MPKTERRKLEQSRLIEHPHKIWSQIGPFNITAKLRSTISQITLSQSSHNRKELNLDDFNKYKEVTQEYYNLKIN